MFVQQMFLNLMEAIERRIAVTGEVKVGDVLEFETETSPKSPSQGENLFVRHQVTQDDLDQYQKHIGAETWSDIVVEALQEVLKTPTEENADAE